MKQNKKAAALAMLSAVVMTAPMALPVLAAEGNNLSPTIDPDRTGSITICKLKDNEGSSKDENGSMDPSVTQPGMKGIEFSVLKIADIETVMSDGCIGTYYTNLDEAFASLLDDAEVLEGGTDIKGRTCYTAGELSLILQNMELYSGSQSGEKIITDYVKQNTNTIVLDETDEDGVSSVNQLPLGLYLAAETDYSHYLDEVSGETVYNPASPFLISVPMTNQDENTGITLDGKDTKLGTAWQYDIVVYPKNQTVSIYKYIVDEKDDSTLVQSDDHEIGEIFSQVITAAAPAVADGHVYEKYVITDTMEDGLNLVSVGAVKIGERIAAPTKAEDFKDFETLTENTDYTVDCSQDKTSFKVIFTAAGLAKLNAMDFNGEAVVEFKTVLTSEASDGDADPNTNKPSLEWKNQGKEEHSIDGNEPKVYAYRLNISKKGVVDASKVRFSMSRGDEEMQFVQETAGVYHVFDNDDDTAAAAVNSIAPAADGKLMIRGLDADTYEIKEIATEAGHELLKNSFLLGLESLDEANGKAFPDGYLTKAVITSGDTDMNISVEKGTAGFTVNNDVSLALKTGGQGRVLLYVLMGMLIAAGAAIGVVQKRKETNKNRKA